MYDEYRDDSTALTEHITSGIYVVTDQGTSLSILIFIMYSSKDKNVYEIRK